jgi:hypothetical protein
MQNGRAYCSNAQNHCYHKRKTKKYGRNIVDPLDGMRAWIHPRSLATALA